MSVRRLNVTLAAALASALGALAFGATSALAIAANGSYIDVNHSIYEVIGGAAIHIDSCTTLDGCPKVQAATSLAGYASVPANGTFIQIEDAGGFVGEVVGGALIHVDSCSVLKCTGILPLDPGGAADYRAAHPTPVNGSLIQNATTGWIGEVAGAAVIHLDECNPLNSCAARVKLDTGGLADYMSAHPTPVDGTFLRSGDGANVGWTGEVIGTAVIHDDSCVPSGGCPGVVTLDSPGLADYIAAHPLPTNGTFVQVADGPQKGLIARVAGGAFLTIGDCAPLGGCPTTVDHLDSGGFNDWSAAHAVPADGTYLLGLPSNTTWLVTGGQRQTAPANAGAVPVDDTSLNVIPLPAPVPPPAVAPISTAPPAQTVVSPPKSTPRRFVKLAVSFGWRWRGARSQLVFMHAAALKRPLKLAVHCVGRGCPYKTLTWSRGSAATFLRRLHGGLYRAGDKLTFTISRRGFRAERMTLTIRYGRAPKAQLLKR